jgi:hypothetical protein
LIRLAGNARNYESAQVRLASLVPLFDVFTAVEAQALAEACVSNPQIWTETRCYHEYLPAFIKALAGC